MLFAVPVYRFRAFASPGRVLCIFSECFGAVWHKKGGRRRKNAVTSGPGGMTGIRSSVCL